MNKTKIVASIGPISYQKGILEEMVVSGADVIRLNMSYSDHAFCKKVIEEVNEVNQKLNASIAVMLDLEGPSVCTTKFKGDKANFKTGDKIRMYIDSRVGSDIQFSVDYPILEFIKSHQIIKLGDGSVVLEVLEIGLDYAVCEVIRGGEVSSLARVHLPGIKINRPFLTNQDKEDIIFACEMNVDFLVISNVMSQEDVLEVNDLLIELNNDHISVLVKIGNDNAVNDIDKIIEVSDGAIIARNDLVVTVPVENVPVIKNDVIYKCRMNGKISIISADLSSFLTEEVSPSRSEVSDLSSAVSLGVDAIILSSETTIGHYPVDAIKQVERIINVSENNVDYQYFYDTSLKTEVRNVRGTIVLNAALSTLTLGCKAVVVATNSGYTAKQISRFRPPCVIIAIVPDEKVAKSLNLHFGVIAVVANDYNFDTLSSKALYLSENILGLGKHDKVVIVGGHPFDKNKNTNFMKIEEI